MSASASGPSASPSVTDPRPPADVARPASAPSRRPSTGPVERVLAFLGSYGLAVTLLLVLLLLTTLGTFAQAHMSLFGVQQKYFESLLVVEDVGPVSFPLPGGALVLGLLAINLIVGGLLRIRYRAANVGILIAHVGIIVLLAGSLVEALRSDKGVLTLYEGKEGNTFRSHYEWEVSVLERKPDGRALEWVVPARELSDLSAEDVLRATGPDLPFTLTLTGWVRNGSPVQVGAPGVGGGGWVAQSLPSEKEAELNMPCVQAALEVGDGRPAQRALLWGGQAFSWAATLGGRSFEIDLRKRTWTLPFSIRLDDFIHEKHPGTPRAKRFSSYVTQREASGERTAHITMNEPLRSHGYKLFQSGWGPSNAPEGAPLYSSFSVVYNPSDQVPTLSCWIIGIGLFVHMVLRLARFLGAEARRKAQGGVA